MWNISSPETESHTALSERCMLASHFQAAARNSYAYKQQKFLTPIQALISQLFLFCRIQTIGIIAASRKIR